MESLNPQHTLRQLETAYVAYSNAPAERRAELAGNLRRAISRGEIETSNLARSAEATVDERIMLKRMITLVELARGSMPPA
jgi:hypothetical protein